MLHSWMGYDPFEQIVDLQVTTDQALRAAIDHSDQFADITIVRFRRGVTAAGFKHAGELNKFSKLGLGEFMESTIDDEGLRHLANGRTFDTCFSMAARTSRMPVCGTWSVFQNSRSWSFCEEGGGMVITDAGLAHVGRMEQLRCLSVREYAADHRRGADSLARTIEPQKNNDPPYGSHGRGAEATLQGVAGLPRRFDPVRSGAAEVQRIVVWKIGQPDEQVNVVSDPERIGQIRALIEASTSGSHQFDRRNDPWPATYNLQFMGRSRVLYEVRLGNETLQLSVGKPANDYPDIGPSGGISERRSRNSSDC